MLFRISPFWWPFLGVASPILIPFLSIKNKKFKDNSNYASELNKERLNKAEPIDLPELEYLDLTILVEEKTEDGYLGDAGVSYFFRSNIGSLLFDVGFGPERPALAQNATKLRFNLDQVDSLVISHLHPDHMGGMQANRLKRVTLPKEIGEPSGQPCFLPSKAEAPRHYKSGKCHLPTWRAGLEAPILQYSSSIDRSPLPRKASFP